MIEIQGRIKALEKCAALAGDKLHGAGCYMFLVLILLIHDIVALKIKKKPSIAKVYFLLLCLFYFLLENFSLRCQKNHDEDKDE